MFVYVYTIATNALAAAPWLMADRRDDHDRSKFRKYENLCLRDQAKRLEKLIFAATNDGAVDGITHWFLSCYYSQRLLFSHSKNNFSTTLTPPKNRDIHIVFFL